MSGIYGIINLKGNPVEKVQMDKMETLMIHRGVDGKAQWIDNHVGLGHLKLEITPESEYEALPLKYKQWVITADCRIDNRDELDEPLSISEEERPFTPDSTYIVKAYEKWGKDCVYHLIGDFAFAIWDTIEQSLFCARDHIGIKPFFYLKTEDKFIFASELKTVVELREIPIELNESKFGDWMYRIQDLHNPTETLFTNIKRLMPAHFTFIKNESLHFEKYWELQKAKEIIFEKEEDYPKKLRELMIQAVECRMRTKYNIGVTLSGGLDSSSVACIAARKLAKEGKNLYTASSVLPNNWEGIEEDEREYIEEVVKQEKNIIPSYASAEGKGAFDDLDSFFKKLYFPINPFYYMDDALDKAFLKQANLRVKLNGFYGDIAVSNNGSLIFSELIHYFKLIRLLKYLINRIKIDKTNFLYKILKQIIRVFIPTLFIKLYKKIKNPHKIGNSAFELITKNSFRKKNFIDDINRKIEIESTKNNFFHKQVIRNIESSTWVLEEINIRNAYLDFEELNPLADIRLLNFMINIPVEQISYQGWVRGLIRFAMYNIIPSKIQYRRHKTMYSPDYFNRIIEAEGHIKNIVKDTENSITLNYYINIPNLKYYLLSVKRIKNWQDSNFDNSPVIFGIGFINLYFLIFFKNLIKIPYNETKQF